MAALPRVLTAAVLLSVILRTLAHSGTSLPSGQTYCVTPYQHRDQSCQTLQFYMDKYWYFSDSTTFVFLPGNHLIRSSPSSLLRVYNVSNLTLIGNGSLIPGPHGYPEPSSQIHCSGTASFKFVNVTSLSLDSLTFVGCGGKSVYGSHQYPALQFSQVFDLTMHRVTVRNSSGWGVIADSMFGTVTDSFFVHNSGTTHYSGGNMQLYYTDCEQNASTAYLGIRSSVFREGNYILNFTQIEYLDYEAGGLSVLFKCSNVVLEVENVTFTKNRGSKGGSMSITIKQTSFENPIKVDNCRFEGSFAETGAAIRVTVIQLLKAQKGNGDCSQKQLVQVLNSNFTSNYAFLHGSGLYLYTAYAEIDDTLCSGGVFIIENCNFDSNHKGYDYKTGGIAIHLSNYIPEYVQQGVLKVLFTNCNFSSSFDHFRDSYSNSAVYVDGIPYTGFENCNFINNSCTGLVASKSNIMLKGCINLDGNRGVSGGGLVLCESSLMYLSPNTEVTFSDNHAEYFGGAIHVETQCLQAVQRCFFQPLISNGSQVKEFVSTVSIHFENNSAGVAGSALFGGSVDSCFLLEHSQSNHSLTKSRVEYPHSNDSLRNSTFVFNHIFHPIDSDDPSFISSDPIGLCWCNDSQISCNNVVPQIRILPGQTFRIQAAVVGQRNGIVPGIVVAKVNSTEINMRVVNNTNTCTVLDYAVCSIKINTSVKVILSAQKYGPSVFSRTGTHEHQDVHLLISIESCPFGFLSTLDGDSPCIVCTCYNLPCDIADSPQRDIADSPQHGIIHRQAPRWIGVCPSARNKLAIVHHCPYQVCTSEDVDIQSGNSSLLNPDSQCAPHRTGTVCGACQHGMSLVLGSNRCQQCSNAYIPVLLTFAVGGLLLVVILTVLNLTVTEGTINGLIFYANVLHANAAIFFPPLPDTPLLKVLASIPQVFIAWLNLDMGIEMCFYDGLDAYTRTWTQFAFPIYIWLIAGVIILLSRKYTIVARATGRHAVQVLATLFLLSFAKLVNTIIDTMNFRVIHCQPDGRVVAWQADGNVMYLQGYHIPLFLAGLMAFAFFALPYCFILISVQCLQRLNIRIIWRLKPFLDSYTGPYKDVCRFWTGHLILIRAILLIASASLVPKTTFLVLLAVSLHLLLLSVWVFRGVYKSHSLDVLESSFILNLTILSIVALLHPSDPPHVKATYITAYISVTVALLTTTGIVIFHAYKQLKDCKPWKSVVNWLVKMNQPDSTQMEQAPLLQDENSTGTTYSEGAANSDFPTPAPMTRFDQYREPVLGFEDST